MDGILSIILFLVVLVVPNGASHAASPAEAYWKTVLPYTPMPTIIQALLDPDAKVSNSFSVRPDAWTRYRWAYTMHAGDVTENKAHGDPMLPLFFLEKSLRPGSTFNLQLTGFVPSVKFLPLTTARGIPFSTKSLPEILRRFSIKPGSPEAEVVKNTLGQCEDGAANQEAKRCATSLESMVDFVTSDLGTHLIKVLATTAEKPSIPKQQYTVASPGAKAVQSSKMVACHAEPYPYAMFVCHSSKLVKGYAVPLVGEDGAKVEAVAICHIDTSKMDPNYIGFQVLNVKPGTVPVCHFLPQGNILWASAY